MDTDEAVFLFLSGLIPFLRPNRSVKAHWYFPERKKEKMLKIIKNYCS